MATAAMAPGDLVACCAPLAVAYCGEGEVPENEDLAELLEDLAIVWIAPEGVEAAVIGCCIQASLGVELII